MIKSEISKLKEKKSFDLLFVTIKFHDKTLKVI